MALNDYGWFLDGHPAGTLIASSVGATLTAGKYYWEVTITDGGADGTNGWGIIAGIAGSNMVLNGTVCTAIGTAQANSQYGVFFNSRADNAFSAANGWGYPNRPGAIPVEAVLDNVTYGLALNTLTKKLWYRNITDNSPAGAGVFSGGASSGDPVAGTEGADFTAAGPSPILTSVFVMVGASHGAAAAKGAGSVNFGASAFVGAVPTGYVSIESGFPGAALNPNDNSNIVLSGSNLVFDGSLVPVTFSPAIGGFTTNVGYSNAVRSRFSIALGP